MRRREFWGLLAPSLVVMVGLLAFPLYRTVEWSLKKVDYGESGTFVGLDNYTMALQDERFLRSVVFTVGLTLTTVGGLVVGGYILACLVNGLGRMRPVVLGILLISYVIPNVVGATMFSWLFDSNFGGVLDYAISGLTGLDILWFTDTWPNRVMVALNLIWAMLPFAMLVILAGLQGISEEVLEAARMDGASTWGVHWHVMVPTLRGLLGFVALISIMDVVRVFDNLVPLSPQGPQIGNESIMMYIFNVAFRDGGQQLGLGSAINVLLIILIVVMLSPFIRDVAREGSRR
ncbi:carbohydrate ABC transporter permease [Nocardioides sp.]|uniref:carbohydrate ABC transporter permease n=1 Tax=Nocardioides sp. TaxID=35761 RepID=UPI0027327FF9|nr:sugar ABC transporter permease [Nocardioides sp.]MDP3892705.1 sugar ABC transporter permease [Nocardioides sp.]